jgi:Fe-S oxidoreductase
MASTHAVLDGLGVGWIEPEPGCCGMAGSFGWERQHAALSRAIGEQRLLPAVRAAGERTKILADGFSCREQIGHATGATPTHMGEFVDVALSRE